MPRTDEADSKETCSLDAVVARFAPESAPVDAEIQASVARTKAVKPERLRLD